MVFGANNESLGFDLRPFNYPSLWGNRAFRMIDELLEKVEAGEKVKKEAE